MDIIHKSVQVNLDYKFVNFINNQDNGRIQLFTFLSQ